LTAASSLLGESSSEANVKLVYLARNPLDAQVVRGALESRGIETQVRGESLWGVRGELPVSADTVPSVWVSDVDEEAALKLIARRRLSLAALAPWVCSRCGEEIEGQFDSCWRCAGASS